MLVKTLTIDIFLRGSLHFYQKFAEDHGHKPVGECLKLSKCIWSTTGVNPWVSIVKPTVESIVS